MRQAAEHFSFAWDETAVRFRLNNVPAIYREGVFRGRWLLGADGTLNVEFHSMPEPVRAVTLLLAGRPMKVDHPSFLAFKTTYRPHYDSFLSQAGDVFDVLLYSAEGVITETCRANVVLKLDGQLWTPAFGHKGKANLLAGVYRASLLMDNVIHERELHVDDLARASAMWLVNSLRGWVSVQEVLTPNAVIRFPCAESPHAAQ